MTHPPRRAVAAVVRRSDGLVLAVRRPDEPGEELRGIWGLPAVTLGEDETPEAGVQRVGREKLGVHLEPLRELASGDQQREGYTLHMTVYQASVHGGPCLQANATGTRYDALDWLPAESLRDAADKGSLCSALFLEAVEIEATR